MERSANHQKAPAARFYNFSALVVGAYLDKVGLSVSGLDNLPTETRPYAIASNHDSGWDPLIMGVAMHKARDVQLHEMAKMPLFRNPIAGAALRGLGAHPVDVSKPLCDQPELLSWHSEGVEQNAVYMQFLQGTRKNHQKGEIAYQQIDDGNLLFNVNHGLDIYTAGIATSKTGLFSTVHFNGAVEVEQQDLQLEKLGPREMVTLRKPVVRPLAKLLAPKIQEAIDEAKFRRESAILDALKAKSVWKRLIAARELEAIYT